MTAARNALTAALLAGRRCAICDKPTGAGWRRYCSSRYCLATVSERRNARRRATYRKQQQAGRQI